MQLLEVRGAPNYYACEQGILSTIPLFLETHRLIKPLIIHGEKSWKATEPFFPRNPSFQFEKYNGECSQEEITRMAKLIESEKADCVIGIGGGKVLDLAKATGNESSTPVILIPTVASTCAAWTPLSVIYDDAGKFLHYTIYKQSTLAVFLEPQIIVEAPSAYVRAGIGDTIAKWYEAEAIMRREPFLSLAMQIAFQSAQLCKENLLADGVKALNDLEQRFLSPELIRTIETIIMAGGMVGGFGDRYGRIAGAHSIHNGLTHLHDTHHLLHGEKVAYGILVQLALENNGEEVKALLPFYKKLNLPYNLSSLGLNENGGAAVETIAYHSTLPHESIHLLESPVNERNVIEAIELLEKWTKL
jgi:hydroxycarboxylate dehydrogenase A